MYNPVKPTGESNWSVEIRKLQDEIKRLKLINVVNGEFLVTSGGTSIVCNAKSNISSSSVTSNSIPRWI